LKPLEILISGGFFMPIGTAQKAKKAKITKIIPVK
jgi:hypothetical protein